MDPEESGTQCSSSSQPFFNLTNSVKLKWQNKFGSETNVPCGLVSYERRNSLDPGSVAGSVENCNEFDNTIQHVMDPLPIAVRSVDVIGVQVDCGLDLTVFQVYENRGNAEKELYYILPVDETMGLYRFEFRSYSITNTGARSRDGQSYKTLIMKSKDDLSTSAVDHQADSFDSRQSSYFKVYIGAIPPMDIIQVKVGFVQELPAVHNFIRNGDLVLQLHVPSIFFPNYGCDVARGETFNAVEEIPWLSNKNQSYAVGEAEGDQSHFSELLLRLCPSVLQPIHKCEDYPVRFILRVFQLFACDFQPIPNVMTFVVRDTRGLKTAKEKDTWHPYQIDGKSSKTEMLQGFQILLSPTFELKREARLVVEGHNGHVAAALSYCINLEPGSNAEVIFLLDQSGSMIGKPMSLAKTVLVKMLENLPSDVNFNVIGFGSNYELFFKQSKIANHDAIEQAISFVENSDATLGYSDLPYVFNNLVTLSDSSVRKSVVLISDGLVNDLNNVRSLAQQFQDQLRVFTVMTGDFNYDGVCNLKALSDATSGALELVLSEQDINQCLKSIIPHITQPAFQTERVGWASRAGLEEHSITPDLMVNQRKNGITYSGMQNTLYTHFDESELKAGESDIYSIKALMTFNGVKSFNKLVVESYESPASYIHGTGATLLFHRLSALRFIHAVKEHTDGQMCGKSGGISPWTVAKIKQISESLNLMSPFTAMAFFKNTKFVADTWAQDTRYSVRLPHAESTNEPPAPTSDVNSKGKRSSRVTPAMPSIKELYTRDYSISCLRDLMIGRNVCLNVCFASLDGSYDLTKEFSSSLKIDFKYLSQARHRCVSKHSWATMIAFTILTNKLGVWNDIDEEGVHEAAGKSSKWLQLHMTEFEISACLYSALKVLWAYFQNEASLQTVETGRKRQSYARFYR